jgi:uncharacterized protein (UPF0335 family)
MPGIGHNDAPVASDQLRFVIERIETLEDERNVVSEYLKEVYLEAKSNGFDPKSIRKLVSIRKKDRDKVLEDKAMLELYAAAIGCLDLV